MFHILSLGSMVSFLGIIYTYYNEMCNEWYELYLWLSTGSMMMLSLLNIITFFTIVCLSTKENIEILKTNRKIKMEYEYNF